jgi:hypothetical protein
MKIVKVDPRHLDYGILIDEAKEWFKKRYNINPAVEVRYGHHRLSSGRNTGGWHIFVTAGTDRTDFIYVLDHEYSHSIDRTMGDPHGDKFHEVLLQVTRQRHSDINHMLKRELSYKKNATVRMMKRHRLALKETN